MPPAKKGRSKRGRGSDADEDSELEMPPPTATNPKKKQKQGNAEPDDEKAEDEGKALPELDLDVELTREEDGGIRLGQLYIPPPPPPALTFDDDRPRLIITHIENENFKSYAGIQTLGPFHKSFTSIVGPNGSGKSNVIDSMLFVFGYRAQKIRSKKISVLIHNSEKHPDVRSCSVRVYFQEIKDTAGDDASEAGTVVEGSRFVVSRTAFKDNTSFYEVNGKRCQFKEVAVLLRQKGIDLDHNRFLILQGEVEQIAQMKAKGQNPNDTGMLEYLEDIIGSSRFQAPIEILKKVVGELEELRGEKLGRLKLVEKEKDQLEGPRNAAIEYLKMENQVAEIRNLMYQHYIHECKKKITVVEEKKAEYEKSAEGIISKFEEIAKQRTELEESLKEDKKKINEIREQKEDAQEKFKKHELEDTKLRLDMQEVNKRRKKVTQLLKEEQERLQNLANVPTVNKEKIDECAELKEKLEAQCEEEQKNYDEALKVINEETKEFQAEKETLQTKLIDLEKDVNEKESAVQFAERELDLINSNEQKEKSALDDLIAAKETSESRVEACKKRKSELDKVVPDKMRQVKQLEVEVKSLSEKEETMFAKMQQLQYGIHECKSSASAQKSQGRVLGALMEQKKCGQIPGIFGRIGDLGAIDQKYDVAISTACGGLDTILVDTVDTAKDCIEFLRRTNTGRANFLALEKTKHFEAKIANKIKTPYDVPRLFDLVRPQKQEFSTAFYHVMRDTLVVEDASIADKVAFGATRFRTVTLSGVVRETSGAMSGGGRPVRGKMGAELARDEALDEKKLKNLTDELQDVTEKHRACQNEKNEKELTLQKFKKELEAMTKELQKVEMELSAHIKKLEGSDERIAKQKKILAKAKANPEQQKELEAKIAKLQEERDVAKEKSDKVNFEVKKLNGKINDVRGSKLKNISKKLDDAKNQLDKVKKEMVRLEVEIKKSERDLEKCKRKIEENEAEKQEAESKIIAMKESREGLEANGQEVISRLKELKETEEKLEEALEELEQKIESIKKAEAKMRSQQIEINETRAKYDTDITEQKKKISHWSREMKKLKLREIPGEEVAELETKEEEELGEIDDKKLQFELNILEEKLSSSKVNHAAIEEYRQKETVYLARAAELDEITGRKDKQRKNLEDLKKQRLNEFMTGYSIITSKLKEMYQMITLGGDAEFELVDSMDPFTEGIVFSVRPPNKSWKNISNLSGGEKTLSSLALVFALHYYKPTPLYVMDEIDAALDFKNVSIVANYIRERTKNAQFIIISLRSNMFELADRLVGIYKTYNCTKSVTINPSKFVSSVNAVEEAPREVITSN